MEVWKIIFLSKWVIRRFQPLIFQGVNNMYSILFNSLIFVWISNRRTESESRIPREENNNNHL